MTLYPFKNLAILMKALERNNLQNFAAFWRNGRVNLVLPCAGRDTFVLTEMINA
jgi:hypothetical protein